MKTFSDNLREKRTAANISRQELADAIGVSLSAIGQYEQGRREPDLQKLVAIAAALHVSLDDLLDYHVDEYEKAVQTVEENGLYVTDERSNCYIGLISIDETDRMGEDGFPITSPLCYLLSKQELIDCVRQAHEKSERIAKEIFPPYLRKVFIDKGMENQPKIEKIYKERKTGHHSEE